MQLIMILPSFSFLLASLMPTVISQETSPPCVSQCSQTAFNSINKACAQTDFACLCKNQEYVGATTSCYTSTCPAADLPRALSFATTTCAQAGVTIAANSTANAVGNAANATANVANGVANATANAANNTANVIGTAGRQANSTVSTNLNSSATANRPSTNSSASTNAQNSAASSATASGYACIFIMIGTTFASVLSFL